MGLVETGIFPRWTGLGYESPTFGTPIGGVLSHYVICVGLCFFKLETLLMLDSGFNILIDFSEIIAYYAMWRSEEIEMRKDGSTAEEE